MDSNGAAQSPGACVRQLTAAVVAQNSPARLRARSRDSKRAKPRAKSPEHVSEKALHPRESDEFKWRLAIDRRACAPAHSLTAAIVAENVPARPCARSHTPNWTDLRVDSPEHVLQKAQPPRESDRWKWRLAIDRSTTCWPDSYAPLRALHTYIISLHP